MKAAGRGTCGARARPVFPSGAIVEAILPSDYHCQNFLEAVDRYVECQIGRDTEESAARINRAYGTEHWKPIVLIGEHQAPTQVFERYRAADFCLVSSLHDGMNLLAKEFFAARDDDDGVLILSTFAGASRRPPHPTT
jgi:trehalose-6-phosphate synthase